MTTGGAAAETAERQQNGDERFHIEISDVDRDSLHILPLSIIPMQTRALRHARLIKNSRLDGVVELFEGPASGSGQVEVDSLVNVFGWPVVPPHPDLILLRKLCLLYASRPNPLSPRIMARMTARSGPAGRSFPASPRRRPRSTR